MLHNGALLGPFDPHPVLIHGMDRESHFLIVCDHAGNSVPASLDNLGLAPEPLADHIGWDVNAWSLAIGLADRLGAPGFGQRYSRLVIDCNRQISAADSIAPHSDGIHIPGNQGLAKHHVARRHEAILAPYHNQIANHISMLGMQTPPCIVSMHTFSRRLTLGPERPWHVGVISGPDGRMRLSVLAYLRQNADGLVIGDNQPYQVGMETDYTLPMHAEAAGHPYVEFEVRNDLFDRRAEREELCGLLANAVTYAYESLSLTNREPT